MSEPSDSSFRDPQVEILQRLVVSETTGARDLLNPLTPLKHTPALLLLVKQILLMYLDVHNPAIPAPAMALGPTWVIKEETKTPSVAMAIPPKFQAVQALQLVNLARVQDRRPIRRARADYRLLRVSDMGSKAIVDTRVT